MFCIMLLELHVWGPAFSLPSIDPDCVAAIAYLSQAVPKDQWILVASNDPLISPTKELPVLRNGCKIIAGYPSIVSYLCTIPNAEYDLDASLPPLQKADSIAFSCLLITSLASLLSLSHYVSSENYTTATRPALSKLLHPPFQYIIPPQFRTAAKIRTEHLGLSALDIDTTSEEQKSKEHAMPGSDQIPRSLRNSIRQTVGMAGRQSQHAAQIRLAALMDSVFGPLNELLGEKQLLLEDERMTSLDCLALGYLALAVRPEMPQSWLAETMKKKYPLLCAFVDVGIKRCFGGPVRPQDALLDLEHNGSGQDNLDFSEKSFLPWETPPPTDLLSKSTNLLSYTLPSLPLVGSFYQSPILHCKEESDISASGSILGPALLTFGAAAAALGSYFLYPIFSSSYNSYSSADMSEKRRLDDMGEVGAMLAVVDFQDEYPVQQNEHINEGSGVVPGVVPVVEVDVVVDDQL